MCNIDVCTMTLDTGQTLLYHSSLLQNVTVCVEGTSAVPLLKDQDLKWKKVREARPRHCMLQSATCQKLTGKIIVKWCFAAQALSR